MKLEENILTLYKSYIRGELNEADAKALESRPNFKEELSLSRDLMYVTSFEERKRLEVLARQASQDHKTLSEKTSTSNRRRLLLGLLILLLGILVYWLFFWQNDPLKKFIESEAVPPAIASTALKSSTGSSLSIAYRDYQLGNYDQSIATLNAIPASDSTYLFAQLLSGHSHFQAGDLEEAVNRFDNLLALRGNEQDWLLPNYENAAWGRLMALASLYESQPSEAVKAELQQTTAAFLDSANPQDIYYEKARALEELIAGL